MMPIATWLSVLILGPGSIAIFAWFLISVRHLFVREKTNHGATLNSPPNLGRQ
jgi:hypothetical protein